jgi:ABC-type multidrug transport system ATPase subunit
MVHLLEADSITLNFGNWQILSDIYLKCETGKVTGLLGRNGHGKSTLMNIIYGTQAAKSGTIRYNSSYTEQVFRVPGLAVYLPQFNFSPKRLTLSRIFEDFDVDFLEFEKRFPEFRLKHTNRMRDLSGGQTRLTETYILLKTAAKFVLLDEPFTHLSPLMIEQVQELVSEAKKEKGILITDHMYRHIIDLSDTLYLLANGKTHLIRDLSELEFLGYAKL